MVENNLICGDLLDDEYEKEIELMYRRTWSKNHRENIFSQNVRHYSKFLSDHASEVQAKDLTKVVEYCTNFLSVNGYKVVPEEGVQ